MFWLTSWKEAKVIGGIEDWETQGWGCVEGGGCAQRVERRLLSC